MRIRGRLVRGLGEAPGFTQLPWVLQQCQAKLGFAPYPGTVNLEVLDLAEWRALPRSIVLTPPDPAFCDASCAIVVVNGALRAATITPHVEGYPEDKLELLAPVSVMAALGIELGSLVTIDAIASA